MKNITLKNDRITQSFVVFSSPVYNFFQHSLFNILWVKCDPLAVAQSSRFILESYCMYCVREKNVSKDCVIKKINIKILKMLMWCMD